MEMTYQPGEAPAEFPIPDGETFARVWQRVMPDQSLSPVVPNQPATPAQPTAPQEGSPPPPGRAAALPWGAYPVGEQKRPQRSFCLEGGAEAIPLLETLMDHTAAAGRDYLALARRSGGRAGRVPAHHAQVHQRQLRRLSAAHFLITGERYLPRQEGAWSYPGSVALALRSFFQREHRWAEELRQGADRCGDPCLRVLLGELSGEAEALADAIWAALEGL